MKKITTVTTKKVENNASQKLTIGLDLGDRTSWYCVLDGAGEVVLEQKLSTTPKAMKEGFGGMPQVSPTNRDRCADNCCNQAIALKTPVPVAMSEIAILRQRATHLTLALPP